LIDTIHGQTDADRRQRCRTVLNPSKPVGTPHQATGIDG
jgi:hypothetical protein